MIFALGFLVIFIGIFIAKKLRVSDGSLLSKDDKQLFEKTKRALGFGSNQVSNNPRDDEVPAFQSGANCTDMHPFTNFQQTRPDSQSQQAQNQTVYPSS